jgi:hypothetical protein
MGFQANQNDEVVGPTPASPKPLRGFRASPNDEVVELRGSLGVGIPRSPISGRPVGLFSTGQMAVELAVADAKRDASRFERETGVPLDARKDLSDPNFKFLDRFGGASPQETQAGVEGLGYRSGVFTTSAGTEVPYYVDPATPGVAHPVYGPGGNWSDALASAAGMGLNPSVSVPVAVGVGTAGTGLLPAVGASALAGFGGDLLRTGTNQAREMITGADVNQASVGEALVDAGTNAALSMAGEGVGRGVARLWNRGVLPNAITQEARAFQQRMAERGFKSPLTQGELGDTVAMQGQVQAEASHPGLFNKRQQDISDEFLRVFNEEQAGPLTLSPEDVQAALGGMDRHLVEQATGPARNPSSTKMAAAETLRKGLMSAEDAKAAGVPAPPLAAMEAKAKGLFNAFERELPREATFDLREVSQKAKEVLGGNPFPEAGGGVNVLDALNPDTQRPIISALEALAKAPEAIGSDWYKSLAGARTFLRDVVQGKTDMVTTPTQRRALTQVLSSINSSVENVSGVPESLVRGLKEGGALLRSYDEAMSNPFIRAVATNAATKGDRFTLTHEILRNAKYDDLIRFSELMPPEATTALRDSFAAELQGDMFNITKTLDLFKGGSGKGSLNEASLKFLMPDEGMRNAFARLGKEAQRYATDKKVVEGLLMEAQAAEEIGRVFSGFEYDKSAELFGLELARRLGSKEAADKMILRTLQQDVIKKSATVGKSGEEILDFKRAAKGMRDILRNKNALRIMSEADKADIMDYAAYLQAVSRNSDVGSSLMTATLAAAQHKLLTDPIGAAKANLQLFVQARALSRMYREGPQGRVFGGVLRGNKFGVDSTQARRNAVAAAQALRGAAKEYSALADMSTVPASDTTPQGEDAP